MRKTAMAGIIILCISLYSFNRINIHADETKDVKAIYNNDVIAEKIYSVDVTWGTMEFIYSESGQKIWNPNSHNYVYNVDSSWISNGNTIKITNHSNDDINVNFELDILNEYEKEVSGIFDIEKLHLDSADGTSVEDAPNKTTSLTMNGKLNSSVTELKTIGCIKVVITE